MKKTATLLVLSISLFAIVPANAQETPSDRPYVEGVVTDQEGKPLAGVQYWTNGYRLGKDGKGGIVHYSGWIEKHETDEDGRFVCVYGGEGREETAIDVAFHHDDYAPTWLTYASQEKGPYTVKLDAGVELTGIAAPNGYRAGDNPGTLFQWPLHLRLDVLREDAGDSATEVRIETNHEGRFAVRLPTDYWNCHYWLYFAGTQSKLTFEDNEPLSEIRINVSVDVGTDSTID